MNLWRQAGQEVSRCHVADGTVKPELVVVTNVIPNELDRLLTTTWTVWTNALDFERLVPSFKLSVALRIVRGRTKALKSPEMN